jgi:two-component system, cell cycle response regulator
MSDRMNNPPLILIVDDDWMSRELLQAHLDGYQVMMSNNGEKALQVIQSRPPDLVIVDVRMPGISGFEFCTRLRADVATRHIPILMLSALEGDEPRQMALEVGANDLLTKPFDSAILMERIRSLLGQA